MNCDEAIHLVNAKIDGQISAVDLARLEEHLRGCARCAEEAGAIEAQDVALRRAFAGNRAEVSIAERVIAELRRRRKRGMGWQ